MNVVERSRPSWPAIGRLMAAITLLFAATLFASAHAPNPGLLVLTFLGGLLWCSTFRRHPNVFAVANQWMIDQTLALDASARHALIVWDGNEPDGVGGTSHMAYLAASHRLPMYTIDPTPRPFADRLNRHTRG